MVLRPAIQHLMAELIAKGRPRSEAWKVFQTVPPHTLELDELISLANQGLVQAADRWELYCDSHGYSPEAVEYFGAYATRRMRGSMLDAMRSADWASRSARARAKLLREAGQDTGLSDGELAERSGLTIEQVRDTRVAQARRPVSLDAEPGHREQVTDTQDVESEVVVTTVLSAAAERYAALSLPEQVILAVVYHRGGSVADAALRLGITDAEAQTLHDQAVVAVHDTMLRAVG